VDGFVITHGTDTMEETAYFLNLVVKTDKPVVLVGSMRPSTAVSADGPLNLYNGVGVAVDPQARGRGVLLVMNDWIHAAHSLTKTSTTAVQTFMSPIRGVVGTAAYGKNDFYNTPPWKHTTESEFSVNGVTKLPRGGHHLRLRGHVARPHRRRGRQRGQGHRDRRVGNGNMNKASAGCRRPRGQEGRGGRAQQPGGDGERGPQRGGQRRRADCIASDELNPQKARVLLALALLKSRTPQELQRLFNEY
jgi:L-asparaginase